MNYEKNGISYSIAFLGNEGWVTYFRKFAINESEHLVGQYTQNLYFNEVLNQERNEFMIYGVPSHTNYKFIKDIFQKEDYDSFLFKEVFVLNTKTFMNCKSDLKNCYKHCIQIQNKDCSLRLKIYKVKDKYLVTLPEFTIIEDRIPSWCVINKPKHD